MIPASVSYIHTTAFDGCPKLVITSDSGSVAHTFYENWKTTNKTEESSGNEKHDTVIDSGGNVYIVGSNGKLEKVESGSNAATSPGSSSALNDPSNVDYVPQFDPITIQEDDILGKTMIVGSNAVVIMDSPRMNVVDGITNEEVHDDEKPDNTTQITVGSMNNDTLPEDAIIDGYITNYAY